MKNLIIIVLIITLISCQYTSNNKPTKGEDAELKDLQDKYISSDTEKNNLQKRFDAVLSRLDTLTLNNKGIEEKQEDLFYNIRKKKNEVRRILLIEKLTPEEKQTAGKLISEINNTINNIK